jgi:S1-C subfamily serine protease
MREGRAAIVLATAIALAAVFGGLLVRAQMAVTPDEPLEAQPAVAAVTPAVTDLWIGATALGSPEAVFDAEWVDGDVEPAAGSLQAQIVAAYEATCGAVVNITSRGYDTNVFGRAVPQEGSASGFVYDSRGHIVTNYHVIEHADELLVMLSDGSVYEAEVVGADPANDLAILRIDAGGNLPAPLALADSDALSVGQFVLAIGNPFGLGQTLTTGVVSALGRVIESSEGGFIGEAIQTDAAINPGNSGGPLLDLEGRVVGINSQIISPSGASAGIGFAVSANTLRRVAPELISRGYYPHPSLGAEMLTIAPAVASLLDRAGMGYVADNGVLILKLATGGPAEAAGIRGGDRRVRIGRYQVPVGGDIIVAVDGLAIASLHDLTLYLETHTVGDTVNVTFVRDGVEQALPVALGEEPQ